MNLLEHERRLTNFLAEHHAEVILKNPDKPVEAADTLLAHITGHPEVKETDNRINNILDAYSEFRGFCESIRKRTRAAVSEKLETVIYLVNRAV